MSVEKSLLQKMQESSYLSGNSAEYIEDLYEQYLNSPQSVSADWRRYFESLSSASNLKSQDISHAAIRDRFLQIAKQSFQAKAPVSGDAIQAYKQARVHELINAYRTYGHFHANIDPLGMMPKPQVPELELSYHDLDQNDLNRQFNTNHFADGQTLTLQEIYNQLNTIYCGTIGTEFRYIYSARERHWIQQRLEPKSARVALDPTIKRKILEELTAAEGLEKYLGAKYVGQKRFSLEGGDSLIPMLDELIQRCGQQGAKEVVIGMAHRGRLNVLINVLGKSPQELFQVFEGKYTDTTRSGDVKYHLGFASDLTTPGGVVHLALAFNPSHLEIVSPVVEGSVRARQFGRKDEEHKQVIPIQIHGDAAFSGQGVVMETFSMSQVRGYTTGGTLHIVINNQVGFTTNPKDDRSTYYCTDIAKMVEAPVFHVNGDDPEAVLFVAQLALDYRNTFHKDVVIDLVCYRRHGHNEADEPAATQPVMYQNIKQHETPRTIYANKLMKENIIAQNDVDAMVTKYRDALDAGKPVVPELTKASEQKQFAVNWRPYRNTIWTVPGDTRVPLNTLKEIAQKLETLPEGMVLQPQVAKLVEDRRKMTAGELPLNWGYAETLAYGTLLMNNYSIRMTGQDICRGTFAHRHAVLHDFNNDNIYIPLQHISDKQASYRIYDSILSEEAVLAFEYGVAASSPESLVIWEAQFGDFANGAQVVFDQFISSGEQKWGRLCGLVMLLPHGYEGQGPEHTSSRLERYLQLCAQDNMQVCVPTTPAQIFHLLRRQMIRPYRKPLIVLTPKSLLRHKLAVSTLNELSDEQFKCVIPEQDDIKADKVRRVILCSGRVYYDLLEQRRANKQEDIALIRVEQLYPFPIDDVQNALAKYKKTKEIIWCQEEPRNQGAWLATQPYLLECLNKDQTLKYVGRLASASPAAGSASVHAEEQKKLVDEALGI